MRHDEEFYQARHRESVIQRSLRKARGEEVDEELDVHPGLEDDEDYMPRSLNRPEYHRPAAWQAPPPSAGGCALPTLFLVLGALAALLIVVFAFRDVVRGFGTALSDAVPDVPAMLATPTPTILSGTAVVQRIQQLNRLETTSYTVERVITVEQPSNVPVVGNWLFGDKLLLIAHGTVTAGLDLQKLSAEDVDISADGQTIVVQLPPIELFTWSLDNSRTRVYDRDRGIFAPANIQLETLARQSGEQQIIQAACEGGIMQRASTDAQRSMEQFLSLLEFERIVVQAATPPACPPPAAGGAAQ